MQENCTAAAAPAAGGCTPHAAVGAGPGASAHHENVDVGGEQGAAASVEQPRHIEAAVMGGGDNESAAGSPGKEVRSFFSSVATGQQPAVGLESINDYVVRSKAANGSSKTDLCC